MVRRTKAEAEETRHRLLDAAEIVFQAKGVSRTTLQDIAQAAGTSRGAIYWHFKDKAALFNAMMDRAILPLECGFPSADTRVSDLPQPLEAIRSGMQHVFDLLARDERLRRALEVATHQVEYNAEMTAARDRHLRVRGHYLALTTDLLELAAQRLGRPLPVSAQHAAMGLHALVDGLLHNWLLQTQAFDLPTVGRNVVDTYLQGLGFTAGPPPARAPHRRARAPSTEA
ncbi:MAG: TetR family transcriptional regulator [Burkholderiales bacterium]|nr:MAG: TetR family transcriptional regulator [Burkholderiales bacterium]